MLNSSVPCFVAALMLKERTVLSPAIDGIQKSKEIYKMLAVPKTKKFVKHFHKYI
jgi:hypothetical protein